MKSRRYPNKLYPHKNYKPIAVDFSLNDYYLLRYTIDDEPANDRQNDLGKHFSPSRFYNGCSTNLLSIYKKCDARYIVHGKADSPQHTEWKEGKSHYHLTLSDYHYKKNRGFVGIKINDLRATFIDKRSIVVQGAVVREDKVYFEIEHAPTKCNFWHFNIMIYGVNSKTNEPYRLRDEEGYSNSQMTKVATALIHKLEDKIVLPQGMRRRYLSKKKYIKNQK